MAERGNRPARGEIDAAALELLARHGAQVLATARRYAATPEDAEDAFQRGIEILLTKAPSTSEDELIPWLKTVVKHEAFALRRQRDRHSPVTDDGELRDRPAPSSVTHEQAERLERLRQGAEALGQLKPHEIRALVLKAEGFSYREICSLTGWSYTKVNRLLTEGRRAFLRRVSGIERGADCAQYEPLLSALADGEARAEDLELLRPHMRTCLSCRAALREFRAAPDRVAAVLPPAALASATDTGPLRSALESLLGAAQQKSALIGERMHAATEMATAQKFAAVAASAAALAGSGTALDEYANHQGPPQPPPAEEPRTEPVREEAVVEPDPAPPPEPAPVAEQPPASPAPPPEPPPPPDPAVEFAPDGADSGAAARPAPGPEFAPASAGSPGGGGEFAP